MTDWQQVISTAAVDQFTRHGRLGAFRLVRRDLVELAAQVMKRSPESIQREVAEAPGFIAIQCQVHCAPLDRAVQVDEWHEPLPSI
jgi:hypothetical protein